MGDILITKNFKLSEFAVSAEFPEYQEQMRSILLDDETDMFLFSEYLKNIVTDKLFLLCYLVLQPTRDSFKVPIHILSGWRIESLNQKLVEQRRASKNSLHLTGSAADFTVDDKALLPEIFKWLKYTKDDTFSELILYKHPDGTPNFIHVALPSMAKKEVYIDEVVR